MSLDRFLQELSFFNDAVDDINDVMSHADLIDDSYYPYVMERLKTACTTLTKASFHYYLVPAKYRYEMAGSLYTRSLILRKLHRGLVMWLLYCKDMEFTFMTMEGETVDILTSDDLVHVYKHFCTSLDITLRLINSSDLTLVEHGHEKIVFLLDMLEELMDMVAIMGYSDLQQKFLHESLSDYVKLVETLDKKAKGRLGIE